jgi:hypothetical protein
MNIGSIKPTTPNARSKTVIRKKYISRQATQSREPLKPVLKARYREKLSAQKFKTTKNISPAIGMGSI